MAKGSGGGGSGPTVAKAYVAIIPTTKDAQKNISKALVPDMEKASEEAGEEGGKSLVGRLGDAVAAGAKKVAAAAKVASAAGVAACGALTTAAYGAFSDWEQLSGGVQTIFGDAAAETVIANARRAFSTVQLSANDYLTTVTSFSASLIKSIGGDTDAAASVADKAITDMADNANKLGTSMESLQYAYQGFSRGTFTMLDNLRLGYGGTQEEMLRLVHDAGVVDESITDISQVSFADMIEGIHIIQQEWGIAGASAAEAATTLEGSFNMMTASWQNMLVAFGEGTPEAIKPAVDALISSVGTWLSNAIPRIGIIISGIVSYIPDIARDIISALPGMVSRISHAFVEQVGNIDIGAMLRPVIDTAMENSLVASIMGFAGRIGAAFTKVFGEVDLAATFATIRGAVTTAMDVITQVITTAQAAVVAFIDSIDTDTLVSIMSVIRAVGERVLAVLSDIGALAIQILADVVWPLIQNIAAFLVDHVVPGIVMVAEAAAPYLATLGDILLSVISWLVDIASALITIIKPAIEIIFKTLTPIFDWLFKVLSDVYRVVSDVVGRAWTIIQPHVELIVYVVSRAIRDIGGFIQTLSNNFDTSMRVVSALWNAIWASITKVASGSISRVISAISGVLTTVRNITGAISSAVWNVVSWISDTVWGLISGLWNAFSQVYDIITSPFRSAFNAIRRLWNSTIGGMGFTIPDWIPGVGGGSFRIPYMASGGTIAAAGTVLVGEQGPELLDLPRGARVTPLSESTGSGGVTYSVMVGDVDLSDDDQVRRVTREYLEFLARLAAPGGLTATA